ncbi:MAG: sensor histidine kinase [Flavobacterium sp.]
MKKALFIALFSIFFFGCNQEEKMGLKKSDNDIDVLLSKAHNSKLDKKVRLKYADRVADILRDKKNDSITRYYYFKLSDRYYNLDEQEKNIAICRDVYKMSQESKDSLDIAKCLQYIGDYHYNKFNNDSAYYYYSKAEKTYLHLKSKMDVNRLKLYKANILFYEKDFSGCETAIINILKSLKQKKDVRLTYECYITLANALEGLNNNEKALEYYNKAYQITENLKKDPQYEMLQAQTYNYLGKIFQKKEAHNKAVNYFKEALNFDNFSNSNPLLYANLTNNLAYSKFKLGDKTALVQLNEALQIRDSLNNIPGIVSSKINLSEYYLAQNDTAKALLNINEARVNSHDNKIFEDELKTLELLVKIDPKNDSYYNNRFIKLTDSLQNNERATRDKFARIEFETDEILNQKNDIEAEKNKISSQRWVIAGSSAVMFLLGTLLFVVKIQRTKNRELQFEQEQQKANEEIYQLMLDQQSKIEEGRQKEKKRISQELHDGIMSKLTSTRLNLFILSRKTDEETIKKCLLHIAEIQNIEKEIRSIAHDLSQDIFSGKDSFKTIIEALFDGQKSISQANCQLEIDDRINWEAIESTTKMHLYRIFQEALQNIHKYAKAKNISATIIKVEDHIHIEITDDGVGFDIKKTREGIGLKNMQSRMKIVQGEIEILSHNGEGTQIILIIPV